MMYKLFIAASFISMLFSCNAQSSKKIKAIVQAVKLPTWWKAKIMLF